MRGISLYFLNMWRQRCKMTSHKTNFSFVLVYPLKIFVNMKKKVTESFNDYKIYIWDVVVLNLNL